MFAGCSDDCIKAILKAKHDKKSHPYTNPHNLRPRPKRPINLQIKEPISIIPIITELNQEKSICNKLELVKKTTDTELYNEKFNKNINTKLEENYKEDVSESELEEDVNDNELDKDQSIHTELDKGEFNDKQTINIESNMDNADIPKTWYNMSMFSEYFT